MATKKTANKKIKDEVVIKQQPVIKEEVIVDISTECQEHLSKATRPLDVMPNLSSATQPKQKKEEAKKKIKTPSPEPEKEQSEESFGSIDPVAWTDEFSKIKDITIGFGKHRNVKYKEMILNKEYHKYIHWLNKAHKENEKKEKTEIKKTLPVEKQKQINLLLNEFYNNKELRGKRKEIITSIVTQPVEDKIIESVSKSYNDGLTLGELIDQLKKDLLSFKGDKY